MSRKHFEVVARALRGIEDVDARRSAAEALIAVFFVQNPRFDAKRFLTACGL